MRKRIKKLIIKELDIDWYLKHYGEFSYIEKVDEIEYKGILFEVKISARPKNSRKVVVMNGGTIVKEVGNIAV